MTTQLPHVHETVVDGVQTFWVDVGPPFSAVLTFRVGIADEALVDRGITHLAEHLALAPLRDVTHPFNGSVGINATSFFATGTEHDVIEFFKKLTSELSDLSLERLETEAGVLIAESMGWRGSPFTWMLGERFGPHGPGVLGYAEYGLRRAHGEDIRSWVAEHFTAQNAVMSLTGPPPPGLQLGLPQGNRHRFKLPPNRAGYIATAPTRIFPQSYGISVGGFGRRSVELRTTAEIVQHRAQKHMRHELGRVYAVFHDYIAFNDEDVFVYWGADAEPAHAREVAEAFDSVLQSILDRGPSRSDLERQLVLTEQAQTLDPIGFARAEVGRYSSDALVALETIEAVQWLPELKALTPEIGAEALQSIMPGAMAIAAESAEIGFRKKPVRNNPKLKGKVYRYRDGDVRQRFVLADDAIAVEDGEGSLTISFADVVLSEHYTGGGRALVDTEGTYIGVDATSRKLRELIAAIDTRVPPGVAVPARRSPG